MNNLLAALSGGLGGAVQGLQLSQAMRGQEEAQKRAAEQDKRRAAVEMLQAVAARADLGLVPAEQADAQRASSRIGEMLQGLQLPGVNAPRDGGRVGMVVGPEAPDTRPRMALPDLDGSVKQFVLDQAQSREGRQRAMQLEDYGRVRADKMADVQLGQQTASAKQDEENRRAHATLRAAFPTQAGAYDPNVDYGTLLQRSDALDRQSRQFGQQRALQDRSFAQQRTLADMRGNDGRPIPAPMMRAMIENQSALSRVDQALGAVNKSPGAFGLTNAGPGAWVKNNVLGASQEDVAARAAVADIGSQIIHDRSGAAVTVSEYPRLAPFIPSPSDRPDVVRAKLTRLRAMIAEEAALYEMNYGPDQGFQSFRRGAAQPGSMPSSDSRMQDPDFLRFLQQRGVKP